MDKLEDLVYKAVHSGEGISMDTRRKIYNQAINDVISMIKDGVLTNKKSLLKMYAILDDDCYISLFLFD